jgi:YVTN family beta-propeller protein
LDRRAFLVATIAAVALLALPGLAAARIAYVTGGSGGGAYAVPVELATETTGVRVPIPSSESSPPDVAITPDGRTAYVLKEGFSSSGGEVVPIDVATNTAGPAISLSSFPNAIAITPDGRFAYVVGSGIPGNTVTKIDLATQAVAATITLSNQPLGIAITPDGRTAYVSEHQGEAVVPIDVATNTVGPPIHVGHFPIGISVTPDGRSAYVLNTGDDTLSKIDIATNTVVATIPSVPGFDLAITPNGSKAYALENSELTPVDLPSGTVGATIFPSGQVDDLAILPDGSRAYLTVNDGGALISLSVVSTNLEEQLFQVGADPNAIAIVPNQPPHAAFGSSPSSPTPGSSVGFDATGSTDSDGSVASYEWDFGDGSSLTATGTAGAKPRHVYAKAGTYQVTLTETDNEGCSTKLVFTGQTAYCNGSAVARMTHSVTVASASPEPIVVCGTSVTVHSSSFKPKRRPGNVVPGVRVRLASSAPARVSVKAVLLGHGSGGTTELGDFTTKIEHWRRVRFKLPASLREELPIGTSVRVRLSISATPLGHPSCPTLVAPHPQSRVLDLHVVKVFPNRVQFKRGR